MLRMLRSASGLLLLPLLLTPTISADVQLRGGVSNPNAHTSGELNAAEAALSTQILFADKLQRDADAFVLDVTNWITDLVGKQTGSDVVMTSEFALDTKGEFDLFTPCGDLTASKTFAVVKTFLDNPKYATLDDKTAESIMWHPSKACLSRKNAVEVDGGSHVEFVATCSGGKDVLLNVSSANGGLTKTVNFRTVETTGAFVGVNYFDGNVRAVGATGRLIANLKLRLIPDKVEQVLKSWTARVRECGAKNALSIKGVVGGGWRQKYSKYGGLTGAFDTAVLGYAEAFEIKFAAVQAPTDSPAAPTLVATTPKPVESPVPTTKALEPVETPVPTTKALEPVETPVPTTKALEPVETPVPTTKALEPVETPVPTATVHEIVKTPAPMTSFSEHVETPEPTTKAPEPTTTPVLSSEISVSNEPTNVPTEAPETHVPTTQPTSQPDANPATDAPNADAPTEPPLSSTPSEAPANVTLETPTEEPTADPTAEPTAEPTADPDPENPTPEPSRQPPMEPTAIPSESPSTSLPDEPSETPTDEPTKEPRDDQSEIPSTTPSSAPIPEPSGTSTDAPSEIPTEEPTEEPVPEPSEMPSGEPSSEPTSEPPSTEEPSTPTSVSTSQPPNASPFEPALIGPEVSAAPQVSPEDPDAVPLAIVALDDSLDVARSELKALSSSTASLYLQSGVECADKSFTDGCFMNAAVGKVLHGSITLDMSATTTTPSETPTPGSSIAPVVVLAFLGVVFIALAATRTKGGRRRGYAAIPGEIESINAHTS